MNLTDEQTVNLLLRSLLIDLALDHGYEDLFFKMSNDGWEQHLVCPEKAASYEFIEKESTAPVAEESNEENEESLEELQRLAASTVVAKKAEEKKKILHQLMVLTRNWYEDMYQVFSRIYHDEELFNRLSITTEKKYRNAVFYLDESTEEFSLKEERTFLKQNFMDALEYYRNNQEPFFIEVKMVHIH